MIPIAIIQIATGHVWHGLAIAFMGMVIIGNIDNLMRPRLVGKDAGMHDLMIFFSTLGGISVFGVMGFIVGPVIAVLILTILDIYSVEFKSHLELSRESGAIDGLGAKVSSLMRQTKPEPAPAPAEDNAKMPASSEETVKSSESDNISEEKLEPI